MHAMSTSLSRPARVSVPRARPSSRGAPRRHHVVARARDDGSDAPASAPPRRAVLGGVAATIAGSWISVADLRALALEAEAGAETVAEAVAPAEGAILITGANSGVGFSAAKQLAAQGKRVVLACRTEEKGATAARMIREKVPDAKLEVLPGVGLEMTDLRKCSDYAKAFLDSGIPLDVLVLNAGIMAVPLGRTEQGHEMHFGVNHLAHFLTQDALMPRLREARSRTGERGRLVACSSIANMLPGAFAVDDLDWRRREAKYEKWSAYAASKAENLLLTDEVARRERDVVANAFHPGIVTTNLVRYILPELTAENRDPEAERLTPNGRAMAKLGIRDADEGAKTHVWLSASAEAGEVTGKFFLDPGLVYPGATREELNAAQDWFLVEGHEPLAEQLQLPQKFFDWRTEANARSLWEQSEEMIAPFRVA